MNKEVRIGLIGAGLAGQAHAFGYRNASMSDSLRGVRVSLATVADPNLSLATDVAERYGFERACADVQEILDDESIDAISVALPNFLYLDILSRALRAGKHVLAEKPLGTTATQAKELALLAEQSGVVAAVGFSYRRVPSVAAAGQAVRDGLIGRPLFARGFYYADYALDPRSPRTWRYQQDKSGGGALIDIGTHVIDALTHILGPISQVSAATLTTLIQRRPLPTDGIGHAAHASDTDMGDVDNDDIAALTVLFASGATGSIQLSRVAAGHPNQIGFEIFGTEGSVSFDSTRSDEFAIFQTSHATPGIDGPRRVVAGPTMPYYNDVSPMRARGTGTGYGEAFIAEVQEFLTAVIGGPRLETTFNEAVHPMLVVSAAIESARALRPVDIGN